MTLPQLSLSAYKELPWLFHLMIDLIALGSFCVALMAFGVSGKVARRVAAALVLAVVLAVSLCAFAGADEPTMCQLCKNPEFAAIYWWMCWAC